MERLKHMGLKRSFVLLAVLCLLAALLLMAGVCAVCSCIAGGYPRGGIEIGPDGTITELAQPSVEQTRVLCLLNGIQMVSMAVLPVGGLCLAGILFYRIKLKRPISVLQMGMERIQAHDLDFTIPEVSRDELGQVCAAFETMRAELLRTNQELWRQAEERKRLNAAFAHDLRNPVTVLKGTVKLLRRGAGDEQALDRLEVYTRRIEQYVEMVLCYLRLDADSTDYMLRAYELDGIVRQAVRRYAGQFIQKKIKLEYEPLNCQVLTDEKWLLFVIDQVLSNALKYTPSGSISITLEPEKTLCIRDTGIGIAPEDLPRVFEKGFTGYNGRRDKRASGIGMYLSRRVMENLGHRLTIDSTLGEGTVVRLDLESTKLDVE